MFRIFIVLLLIGLSSNLSFAQDMIIKQNGDEIKSKVLEITTDVIKYKEFDFQNGPIRNIKITDVFMIIYENGNRETFSTTQTPASEKEVRVKGNPNRNVTKRGFIGLELGANIPVGKFADENDGLAKTGFQINLINIGYLFSENVGLTATWFGASNPIEGLSSDYLWSHGGLLVGPLFSFPVSENTEWDIKPMIGLSWATITNSGIGGASAFAFNIGTGFRFNISRLMALTLGLDYRTATFQWDIGEQSMGTIALKGGFAFRLK